MKCSYVHLLPWSPLHCRIFNNSSVRWKLLLPFDRDASCIPAKIRSLIRNLPSLPTDEPLQSSLIHFFVKTVRWCSDRIWSQLLWVNCPSPQSNQDRTKVSHSSVPHEVLLTFGKVLLFSLEYRALVIDRRGGKRSDSPPLRLKAWSRRDQSTFSKH